MVTAAMALLATVGCHKTHRANVTQPNPLVHPNETLRESEPVVIITGDMELRLPRPAQPGTANNLVVSERLPLRNVAQFTVVSRDRLRFHVQLEHKWQDYANVRNWRAYLVDDQGHRYSPVALESAREGHLVSMWDFERRTAVRNGFGDIAYIRNDGYRNRQTLGSLSVFRGRGDFVFYSRDIFSSDLRQLSLVLERRGYTFVFTWKFDDDVDPEDALELVAEQTH